MLDELVFTLHFITVNILLVLKLPVYDKQNNFISSATVSNLYFHYYITKKCDETTFLNVFVQKRRSVTTWYL